MEDNNPFGVPDDPDVIIPLDPSIEKHAKYWESLLNQDYIIKLDNICIFDFTLSQLEELIDVSNLSENCWNFLYTLKSFNDLSDNHIFEMLTKWCPCVGEIWEHPRVVKYLSANHDSIISILENCNSGKRYDQLKIVFLRDVLVEQNYYGQLENIIEDWPDFEEWLSIQYDIQTKRLAKQATKKGLIQSG